MEPITILGDSTSGKYNIIECDFTDPVNISTYNSSLCAVQTTSNTQLTIREYKPQAPINPFTQFEPGSGYVIRAKQNFSIIPPSIDRALDVVYNDGVINTGDNGGYGFTSWSVQTNGVAGSYINSSVAADQGFGNIDTDNEAWGIFAGAGATGYFYRETLAPLAVGQSLSAVVATSYRTGSKGVNFFGGPNKTNFLFNFNASNDQYAIQDLNSSPVILNPAAGEIGQYSQTAVWELIITRTTASITDLVLKRRDLGVSTSFAANTFGLPIRGIEFYIENAPNTDPANLNAQNIRFNSLKIY